MAKIQSDVSPFVKNEVTKAKEKMGITEAQFVRQAVKEKLKLVQK